MVFVVIGLVVAALGVPLARRAVPPNRLYGVRLPITWRDERVWYEANARAGCDMIVAGGVIVAAALTALAVDVVAPDRLLPPITVVALGVSTVKGVVVAYRIAARLGPPRR